MVKKATLRNRWFHLLTPGDTTSKLAMWINIGLGTTILINVLSVVFDTVPDIAARHADTFIVIEMVSVIIFGTEYLARVWIAPEDPRFQGRFPRLRYMISPMAIIDLVAILPVFLFFFTSMDLRFIRIFRLLRLLKFTRYSTGLELMVVVIRQQLPVFGAAVAALLCLLMFSAGAIYLLEHRAQPEYFGDLPKSLYWTVITLTTVGYGDVVPVTVGGKIFATLIALTGVGIVAVPAGILASAFTRELSRREESFRSTASKQLAAGGRLTEAVKKRLESHRQDLGLSDTQAEEIIADIREIHHRHLDGMIYCPHCHRPLHLDLAEEETGKAAENKTKK